MGYHPRIEPSDKSSFLTSRCRNSKLWFANNRPVEEAILGYAAKFKLRYDVKLYALAIEGSHIQAPADFPLRNRAKFMQDFNSNVARCIPRYTSHYPGGRLFERRYSSEFMPGMEDIEEYFFYTVLQPVNDGLVSKLSEYPFYNCFNDAVNGIERLYKVVDWTAYHAKKRYDPSARIKDFTKLIPLKYNRLPGYEGLSQKDYSKLMSQKLEERRVKIVNERLAAGKGFLGRDYLLTVVPGTPAKNPKRSKYSDHRPRVLSICPERRAVCLDWYFRNYFDYKIASKKYRQGDLHAIFPEGMYPPSLPCYQPT